MRPIFAAAAAVILSASLSLPAVAKDRPVTDQERVKL